MDPWWFHEPTHGGPNKTAWHDETSGRSTFEMVNTKIEATICVVIPEPQVLSDKIEAAHKAA